MSQTKPQELDVIYVEEIALDGSIGGTVSERGDYSLYQTITSPAQGKAYGLLFRGSELAHHALKDIVASAGKTTLWERLFGIQRTKLTPDQLKAAMEALRVMEGRKKS